MATLAKKDMHELIIKNIRGMTKDWIDDVFAVEEKMSAKAKKLSKILSGLSHSVADKEVLAEVISELSGEDVRIEKDTDLELHPMVAIVLTNTTEKDKHTYNTDTVLISLGDGTAVDESGKVGSLIPPTRRIVRPATEKEIDAIPEAQTKGLQKEVTLLLPR